MAKEAASRSLDYSLSADVLDRIKDAGKDKMAGTFDETIGEVGKTISEGLIGIDTAKKKKEAEAEAEAKKAEADLYKKEEEWNKSFEAHGARVSWATPELFEMFAKNEETYKDDYLAAVQAEDTVEASKILKQQEQRSASIQAWKTAFQENKDAHTSPKTGESLYSASLSGEDKHTMSILNSQKPGSYEIAVDDENEVYFKIKDSQGNPKNVYTKDLNDIIANNMKATSTFQKFELDNATYVDAGKKDPSGDVGGESVIWNEKKVFHKNSKMINKGNIKSLYKDALFSDVPFADTLLDHPEFSMVGDVKLKSVGVGVGGDLSAEASGAAADGKIDPQEFTQLSIEDKKAVIDLMLEPENFEIAKGYLAEYMTLLNKTSFNNGQKERSQKRKSVGAKNFDVDKFE